MPEGAEYVKLSKDLQPWVGKKITRIEPFWDGYQKFAKIPLSWKRFEVGLLDRKITGIMPYGKNLWVLLERDAYWRIHLSSTGWLEPSEGEGNPLKAFFLHSVSTSNTRLMFHLSDGSKYRYLDARTWGKFYLYEGQPLKLLMASVTGPSWLVDKTQAWENFIGATGKRRVKDVMNDQHIAAGVGNYVSCEALFLADVHPHQTWNQVPLEKRRELAARIVAVLEISVNAENHNHWKVFDKKGEPCTKCEAAIAYVKDAGGDRGSYFCPNCQKL